MLLKVPRQLDRLPDRISAAIHPGSVQVEVRPRSDTSAPLRAIKAGRLSATRDDIGQWAIDPSELFRVFPALALPATAETAQSPQMERDATADILVAESGKSSPICAAARMTCGRSVTSGRPRTNASRPRTPPRNGSCYPRPQRLRHRTQHQEGRAERLMERRATASCGRGAGCARRGEGYHG